MKEQTWERHSNPLSVWTRVFTNPLVCVPVWNRSWRQVIPVAAWFVLNPRLFPPPKDDSSWATRSVLGEQIWTRTTKYGSGSIMGGERGCNGAQRAAGKSRASDPI